MSVSMQAMIEIFFIIKICGKITNLNCYYAQDCLCFCAYFVLGVCYLRPFLALFVVMDLC